MRRGFDACDLPHPEETYNGWANRATWNVALWVQNDEGLYRLAVSYVNRMAERRKKEYICWTGFLSYAELEGRKTPDGYPFAGERIISYRELTKMLKELLD